MTIILKQIAVMTHTNSNTVAGKSFSFSHVLLLLWLWMRNFFWRLYLIFCTSYLHFALIAQTPAHYRYRSCSYLIMCYFWGDEIFFFSPQNKLSDVNKTYISKRQKCELYLDKSMKMRSTDPRATVVTYAFFHAFKFPDSMAVHIRYVIISPWNSNLCRFWI